MEESLERFKQLFYGDELQAAAELLATLKPSLAELTPEMQKLQEDLEYIEYAKDLYACPQWNAVKNSDGISVECKGADTELICKITTTIDAPLLHVLSVVAEVQLLHNWVETATDYSVFSEPTHFRKLLHYNIWFPWPFKDRSCFMECVAVPVKEQKAALIILRSPKTGTYLGQPIPRFDETRPRVQMHIAIFHVQYLSETQTKFTLIVRANPSIVSA